MIVEPSDSVNQCPAKSSSTVTLLLQEKGGDEVKRRESKSVIFRILFGFCAFKPNKFSLLKTVKNDLSLALYLSL
jgi:hypothetical protein